MGYYKKKTVVIIPAASKKAFNDSLAKQGYGPNNLQEPIVGKASNNKDAAITHYVMECTADDGLVAAIELARKSITGSISESQYKFEKITVAKPAITKDSLLDKNNLKTKDKLEEELKTKK
jgi:hypothetical protein